MRKKQIVIGAVSAGAAVVLLLFVLARDPRLAPYLPSFPSFGPSSDVSDPAPAPDDPLDPRQVDKSVHGEDIHPFDQPVTLSLDSVTADTPTEMFTYSLRDARLSRSPLRPDTPPVASRDITTDGGGKLTSPHVYVQVTFSVVNAGEETVKGYPLADNLLTLCTNGAIADTAEMRDCRCLSDSSCLSLKSSVKAFLPGAEHVFELTYVLPEFWFTGGDILFRPNHRGLDAYKLQMQGKRTQYIETGLGNQDAGLAEIAEISRLELHDRGDTVSDDRFTHLTYRIENAAVSSRWDTALTPVPGGDGPIPPTADNGSYLYLDIALGNPMGPIEVPMENREVSAADISLSGLPLYPPAGNGALGQPLTLLASNTAEGTLTLASGESRTVRLGFFLPEDCRDQTLYLACSCDSVQGRCTLSKKGEDQGRALMPEIQWIALDCRTLSDDLDN